MLPSIPALVHAAAAEHSVRVSLSCHLWPVHSPDTIGTAFECAATLAETHCLQPEVVLPACGLWILQRDWLQTQAARLVLATAFTETHLRWLPSDGTSALTLFSELVMRAPHTADVSRVYAVAVQTAALPEGTRAMAATFAAYTFSLPAGTECAICMEAVTARTFQLQCKHVFHEDCLENWQAGTCPLCRELIRKLPAPADPFLLIPPDVLQPVLPVAPPRRRGRPKRAANRPPATVWRRSSGQESLHTFLARQAAAREVTSIRHMEGYRNMWVRPDIQWLQTVATEQALDLRDAISEIETTLVMSQAGCSLAAAIATLQIANGDIVEAIMYATDLV